MSEQCANPQTLWDRFGEWNKRERPPSLEALYSGALGEIRTPYPLVRRQEEHGWDSPYGSIDYKAGNLSQNSAFATSNPLFYLVTIPSNEMNFSTDPVESRNTNLATNHGLLVGFSSGRCS